MKVNLQEAEIHVLQGVQQGDEKSFAQLFDRYWHDLYVLAYRHLRSINEAEDMVQEVFADIWQRHEQIHIHTSFWAYLQKSLKYRIIRAASRADLHQNAMEYLMRHMQLMENTIIERITAGEIKKTVSEVVHTFPESMQKVFALRMEDYTVEEVAKSLGLAVQTVKNNQSEALKRLKTALTKQHDPISKSIYLLFYFLLTKN